MTVRSHLLARLPGGLIKSTCSGFPGSNPDRRGYKRGVAGYFPGQSWNPRGRSGVPACPPGTSHPAPAHPGKQLPRSPSLVQPGGARKAVSMGSFSPAARQKPARTGHGVFASPPPRPPPPPQVPAGSATRRREAFFNYFFFFFYREGNKKAQTCCHQSTFYFGHPAGRDGRPTPGAPPSPRTSHPPPGSRGSFAVVFFFF